MEYIHKNIDTGIITISDSKGIGYILHPGDTVSIDKLSIGNGVICIQKSDDTIDIQVEQKITKNRKTKKSVDKFDTNED